MTNNYSRELQALDDAYTAALSTDVDRLARIVDTGSRKPLISVGSGGSFSTASFASFIHEHFTGQMCRPVTPLEFLSLGQIDAGVVCFSASGKNRDINVTFKTAALREYRPTWALVLANNTAMHTIADQYKYINIIAFPHASFADGYLAVSSLVSSAVLLLRSYEIVADRTTTLPDSLEELARVTLDNEGYRWIIDETAHILTRAVVSVLYTPPLESTATDIESRFVEAALRPIHFADLRNFGHGRHFWFAKHASQTGVLALIGEDHNRLANRTLNLLPKNAAIARIDMRGPTLLQVLSGLIVGLYFAAAGGKAAEIDPGRPRVPSFGRRIFRLPPSYIRTRQSDINCTAAIARKQRSCGGDTKKWKQAWLEAFNRLRTTSLRGLVLDFDGTICDARRRFDPLPESMSNALIRSKSLGLTVGIATGRGPSAGAVLRDVFPKKDWKDIIIGYYNGSVVTTLADTRDPIAQPEADTELMAALLDSPALRNEDIRENNKQVSIRLRDIRLMPRVLTATISISAQLNNNWKVLASGHSIDIVPANTTKKSVVDAVDSCSKTTCGEVVRIGDKGNRSGNDAELLDHPYGLSVDSVSESRSHCWNLAPAGVLGVQATLYYLAALRLVDGAIFMDLRTTDRGIINAT